GRRRRLRLVELAAVADLTAERGVLAGGQVAAGERGDEQRVVARQEPIVASLRGERFRRDLIALDELVGAVDRAVAVQVVQDERAGLRVRAARFERELVVAFLARDLEAAGRGRAVGGAGRDDEASLGRSGPLGLLDVLDVREV